MIQQINNLRQLCSLILDEIYLKIKNIHEKRNKLKKTIDNLPIYLDKMINEYNLLIIKLESFNKYDKNFDYYFEDIKIINKKLFL